MRSHLNAPVVAVIFIISCFSPLSFGSNIDQLLKKKALEYELDLALLRSIATKESSLRPWSVNIDGEGYHFASKQNTLHFLSQVQKNQWLVKVILPREEGGKKIRRYLPSLAKATTYFDQIQNRRIQHSRKPLITTTLKHPKPGQYVIRNVRIENTDLGLMQINYRIHGSKGDRVSLWLDPEYNIDYAARFLKKLLTRDKNILIAASYYHSSTPSLHRAYMDELTSIYAKERRLITNEKNPI